jgi:hypothetical protein
MNMSAWDYVNNSGEVTQATRDFWHESGSVNAKSEFTRYLHLFSTTGNPTYPFAHEVYPWVNIMPKLDVAELAAYWHITEFNALPIKWCGFWGTLHSLRAACSTSKVAFQGGPFWMLLPTSRADHLAQVLVGMKRKLTNEAIRLHAAVPTFVSYGFHQAMEPYRVMTPQQERDDEIARLREIGSAALQIRDRDTFGKPPRCR